MNHRVRREWKKRILAMVVAPALFAGILFLCARKDDLAAMGRRAAAGAAGGGSEAGTGKISGSAPPQAFQDEKSYLQAVFGRDPDGAKEGEEIRRIAFTAGGRDAGQRSFPVQIDGAILGGGRGSKCWAVFVPGEMSEHPHIVFRDYETVSFEELEGETAEGAALGYYNNRESSGKGLKYLAFSSGDEAEGLESGRAYRVRMKPVGAEEDGGPEEILYYFSCEGTASMYLDTDSGSMEKVDGDKNHEASEEARFAVYRPDGTADSAGACSVSGRGNSTWKMKKRPYNLNLGEKQSILGMEACKKLCLLSNSFDHTNLLDRISAELADSLSMRDTPDGEFVNLFLNGRYNGLYYLSQRVRTGGSVHIDKLDDRISEANRIAAPAQAESEKTDDGGTQRSAGTGSVPKRIPLFEEGDKLKKYAYDWPAEPADNTGGYLLQLHERYNGEDCWFSTEHRRFRVISPSRPTVGEVEYLQEYLLAAERAIYSGDGRDPETGKAVGEFLDMDTWEDMFLLEEFFVEWDAERWSFFITKDRGDPLLHCGPMWDFDHAAGLMIYGDYPETTISTLMLRDNRRGWINRLLAHEDFLMNAARRWRTRFSPLIHEFLERVPEKELGEDDAGGPAGASLAGGNGFSLSMEGEIAAIESAAYMNNVRRANDTDFRTDADALQSWLARRADFLDQYFAAVEAGNEEEIFCRVLFQFPWGALSHYVKRGGTLGFLPTAEYGETQVPSQVAKHEIIGWKDEDGAPIGADVAIDRDRVFEPVYRE